MSFGVLRAITTGITTGLFFTSYFDLVSRFNDYQSFAGKIVMNPLARVDGYDERGWQPIHFAVEQGNFEATRTLIERFPVDINSRTLAVSTATTSFGIPAESTPLVISIIKGNLEIFQYLMSLFPQLDLNTQTQQLKTPLHFAAEIGNLEMIETLLARGAKIRYLRGTRRSPFHLAMAAGHVEVAQWFADRNLGVGPVCRQNPSSSSLEPILHFLARQRLPVAIWMKMLEICIKPIDRNSSSSYGIDRRSVRGLTALQVALEEGNSVAIAGFIVSGASLRSVATQTPLISAILEFFNGNAFDSEYFDPESNESIWHFCARHNAVSLLQVLDVTVPKNHLQSCNSQGLTALDLALEQEDRLDAAFELIILHEHVIDDEVLARVACHATWNSWDQVIEALITEFPSQFAKLASNSLLLHSLATAPILETARNPSTCKLVQLLVKNYPQIIASHDKYGRTPMHLALECEFQEFFHWLREAKKDNFELDLNVQDDQGKAFFDLLVEREEKAILELLLDV